MPLKRINERLNELAGTTARSNQDCINILAGTTGLEQQDAFNIWAGTSLLSRQGAANVKAGTTALSLQEALEIAEAGGGSITDPTDISGLVFWYDIDDSPAWTDDGTTPAGNNDLLYRWDDLSGNGRNLIQATATNRPTYASAGESVLVFDGVDNYMTTAPFTLNQPLTIIAGLAPIVHAPGSFVWDGNTLLSGALSHTATTDQITMNAGNAAPLRIATFGDFSVFTCVYNGGSSRYQINDDLGSIGDTGAGNPGGFRLGANGGVSLLFYSNMQVKFLVCYNSALSAANRTLVYNWAITKWPILAP